MMQSPTVHTDVQGATAVVTLARPAALNALDYPTMIALRDAFEAIRHREDVRAVVLTGEGRAFCAGLDLRAGIGNPEQADRVLAGHELMKVGTDLVWTMRSLSQPVIAAVNGYAVGAGFAFAAAADVRFVGPDAVFSAPFLKLGMTVGDLGLSWFLPRIVGLGRATELFFSAGELSSDRAVDFGLATRVSENPMADALAYAEAIAQFPRYAVEESKRLINAGASATLRDHLDAEARAQVVGLLTVDAADAMADALTRR